MLLIIINSNILALSYQLKLFVYFIMRSEGKFIFCKRTHKQKKGFRNAKQDSEKNEVAKFPKSKK